MALPIYQQKEIEKRRDFVKEFYPKLISEGYSSGNAIIILAARKKVGVNTIRNDIKELGINEGGN